MLRAKRDEQGKYGRWLADLFVEEGHEWVRLNQQMLDLGIAEPCRE